MPYRIYHIELESPASMAFMGGWLSTRFGYDRHLRAVEPPGGAMDLYDSPYHFGLWRTLVATRRDLGRRSGTAARHGQKRIKSTNRLIFLLLDLFSSKLIVIPKASRLVSACPLTWRLHDPFA